MAKPSGGSSSGSSSFFGFFFGTPQRCLGTAFAIAVVYGIYDPVTVHNIIARFWNTVLCPLIGPVFQLLVVLAIGMWLWKSLSK